MALRVARWEDVQTLSIILAGFNVALAFQACLSTRLAPEDVLVWGPSLMTLVIDAGAMEQFLTLGRKNFKIWLAGFWKGAKPVEEDVELEPVRPVEQDPALPVEERPARGAKQPTSTFVAFVTITSSLLLLMIFGLQIAGLVAAFQGRKKKDVRASWCSPMFSLFGVAEFDSNCVFREISGSPNKGLGCIELDGKRQRLWLMVTLICLLLSVVVQMVDLILLCSRFRRWAPFSFLAVNLQRPWATITLGFGTLVLILAFGANDAYTLPYGISENIWLVVDSGEPFVCTGTLTPAGERGQFLGWLDGIFQSWGSVYFGPET
ncbi:hypothetical protein LTR84_007437 [Exophiala bonariae]|uniref:Uncharacterized protein n=1 Tax=Exophiala bonariae TaxID=1690606 RepID=A0AAV9N0F0_9EURO|nr:hypothetical protein LTR84_007437 [Exophiala bonariae]